MRGGNQVPKNTAVAEEWYTWEAGREECMFSVTRVNAVRDDYYVRNGAAEMRSGGYRVRGTRGERGPCPAVQGWCLRVGFP